MLVTSIVRDSLRAMSVLGNTVCSCLLPNCFSNSTAAHLLISYKLPKLCRFQVLFEVTLALLAAPTLLCGGLGGKLSGIFLKTPVTVPGLHGSPCFGSFVFCVTSTQRLVILLCSDSSKPKQLLVHLPFLSEVWLVWTLPPAPPGNLSLEPD